ncbi:hypothetical protein E2C01_074758 [Portunus trituberculatus]|uniref:Uncharacterized protein n=1 Tax=Portunus trituberculatus TaxID=210409 RepID=A0A5B7IF44_PORTR|nr:hypothetical protein [Portunus trituberculatus]
MKGCNGEEKREGLLQEMNGRAESGRGGEWVKEKEEEEGEEELRMKHEKRDSRKWQQKWVT